MAAYSCDGIEGDSKFLCLYNPWSKQEELGLKILVSNKILESILGMTLQPMHSGGFFGGNLY